MLEKYRKIDLLKDYIDQTEAEVRAYNEQNGIDNAVLVNGRRQTNLGVFRAYLTAYLKSLPVVNKDLNCMVRHLQPTDHGLPVELYFFSTIKDWFPTKEFRPMSSTTCWPLPRVRPPGISVAFGCRPAAGIS